MNRRYCFIAAALALVCCTGIASAQNQVGADFFTGPDNNLINFDTDPNGNPIASGTLLQNVYSSIGVTFEANDRAVEFDFYGTSSPNQASGSANDIESMNVYFDRGVDAVGAWGYDFVLRTFDADGNLIFTVQYTDGHPCPEPFNFREQRFLGISSPVPIVQAQFSRFYQEQTACGFRIDDLQFIQPDIAPPPPPLAGNIQINWGTCSGQLGSSPYTVFDCDPTLGSIYNLVGTFQVMSPFPNMIAADVSFDIVLDGQTSLPAFWHFESGGCNNSGLAISAARPASCGPYLTPWGAGGSQADAFLTAYQAGTTFGNYGRLLATVARDFNSPFSLAGQPARYFGYSIDFNMDNGESCAGCGDAASIRVNSLNLFDTGAGAGRQIDQGGPGSQPCASINGGGTSCNPTNTKSKTWGQLKSLYR